MLPKVLWNSLLVAPALLGAALIASPSAIAADIQGVTASDVLTDSAATPEAEVAELNQIVEVEAPAQLGVTPVEQIAPAPTEALVEVQAPTQLAQVQVEQAAPAPAPAEVDSLDQIVEYSNEGRSDTLGQVTSISQLSDVQPTDWAFQALQSLVERYGVIAGYPDGTYRGNRALTRYEFAAGLNAALDRVNELIAAGLSEAVTQEDLATLQRLQEEFAAELATLRGRVDALEARVDELEENQFSTTTVLVGETIFNVSGVIEEDEELDGSADTTEDDGDDLDSQIVFGYRVRLNFDTSFTGEDRLRARLQARDVRAFDSDPIGFAFGGTNNDVVNDQGDRTPSQDVFLDDLYYSFPIGERINVLIGANSIDVDDFVASTISPLDSPGSGSISDFGFPRQYTFAPGDQGAGASFQLSEAFSLDFGYTAEDGTNPDEENGLFNGDYSAIGQLTFLSDFLDAALTYVHAYAGGGNFGDSVFSDALSTTPQVANTYGAQVNFKLADGGIQIGGGISYTSVIAIETGSFNIISYQGTLAFPDLGGEGNLLGFMGGVTPRVSDVGDGFDDFLIQDASLLFEGFYKFQVTDNISITPGVIWVIDPFNNNDNEDTIIGALRTTFRF